MEAGLESLQSHQSTRLVSESVLMLFEPSPLEPELDSQECERLYYSTPGVCASLSLVCCCDAVICALVQSLHRLVVC